LSIKSDVNRALGFILVIDKFVHKATVLSHALADAIEGSSHHLC